MNKLLISTTICTGLFFTGCLSTYDAKPSYDAQNKTVSIDTLVLDEARESVNATNNDFGGAIEGKSYLLNNKNCNFLKYQEGSTRTNYTYQFNFDDILYRAVVQEEKSDCLVNKISNLRFYTCEEKKNKNTYLITNSENADDIEYGYNFISLMELDEKCFLTVYDHFYKKSKENNDKPESYSLKDYK